MFFVIFWCNSKALGKLGNIVAETKFASQEAKVFPNKFRNIFVAETILVSQFARMFSNVSNTSHIVFPIGHVQTMFKDYSANINNTSRLVRANVSQKMFPSLPTVGNMTKLRQETMLLQQCFPVCPGINDCSCGRNRCRIHSHQVNNEINGNRIGQTHYIFENDKISHE